MALPSVFNPSTTQKHLERLEKLSQSSAAQWGKMNSAQMLAHLNVAYDLAYEKTITHPNFFTKLMLKLFVKGIVTSEKSYPKNSRTAPEFIIADARDFEKEKAILINNIKDTEAKGVAFFEGRKSQAFGVLTSQEWSNQLYKHIEHHFEQFAI